MAAFSTILGATGAAVGVGQGAAGMISGNKQAKAAQRAISKYKRQDATNTMAGMSVPTEGYTMEQKQLQQSQAEAAVQLSQLGAQGVIGGATSLAGSSQRSMADISNRLSNAQFQMQQMISQEEQRIQGMRERREEQDLAGLGAQYAYGRTQQQAGMQTAVGAFASGAELVSAGAGQPRNRDTSGDTTMQKAAPIYNTQLPSYNKLPSTTTLKPM